MEAPPKILGLDPATTCGWSHSDGSFGEWELKKNADDSSGMRLVSLWNHLEDVLQTKGIDILGFESSMNMRGHGIKLQARFEAVILLFAETKGINYRAFNPKELKKLVTGSGAASKDDMKEFAMTVRPKAKESKMTFDMADAICVMRALENELTGVPRAVLTL